MNLKTLGRMVPKIIRIIAHNPYENKSIRMTKNHKPSKGEKGHSKGEKGEPVRRLLMGKVTNQRVPTMIIPSRIIQSKRSQPPIDSLDQVKYRQGQSSTIILKASMTNNIISDSQALEENMKCKKSRRK